MSFANLLTQGWSGSGSGAPNGLPSYLTTATRRFDPIIGTYGDNPGLQNIRAKIGLTRAGLGLTEVLGIGDSQTSGNMGSAAATPVDYENAFVRKLVTLLNTLYGVPLAGTGWIPFSNFTQAPEAVHWSTTGAWNRQTQLWGFVSAAGATATLTALAAEGFGTNVSIAIQDQSVNMQYDIFDNLGANIATGTLVSTGTVAMKVFTFSGLVNAKSIVITTLTAGSSRIVAAKINRLTGIMASNFAYSGTQASGASGWAAAAPATFAGPAVQLLVPSPDLVLGTLGGNDQIAAVAIPTTMAALGVTYGRYPNASKLIMAQWQPGALPLSNWEPFIAAQYAQADAIGANLMDLHYRSGGYAQLLARGEMQDGATATHPNQGVHLDTAQAIATLIAA